MQRGRPAAAVLGCMLTVVWGGTARVGAGDVFVVTSTADPGDGVCDSGECTLREAIAAANADAIVDTITFDIPGGNPHTIRPSSPLPPLTQPVVLDATTQPGYAGSPVIELDGSLGGGGAWGIVVHAASCAVRGFVVNRFDGGGILLDSPGDNVVQGNYVGTDIAGTGALPNGMGIGIPTGEVDTAVADEGGLVHFEDAFTAGIGLRFYRARQIP